MAARLDIDVDEGATWQMTIEFWENIDKTIPVNIDGWEFQGAIEMGRQYIPMTITQQDNIIEASISFQDMENLDALQGKYDIESRDTQTDEKYRVIQGSVRGNREVTRDIV